MHTTPFRSMTIFAFLLAASACAAQSPGQAAADAPLQPAQHAAPAIELHEPSLTNGLGTIRLPAAASEVLAAGGGRYLVIQMKTLESVAIVDICDAKVVGVVELPHGETHIAAGLMKFFVSSTENNSLARYDLQSRKKEVTVLAPEGGIQHMAMGAGSLGPLVVANHKKTLLMDPETFAPTELHWEHFAGANTGWLAPTFRVSGDGRTIAASDGGWAGAEVATVSGGQVIDRHSGSYIHEEHPRLSFDGSNVFANFQVLDNRLEPLIQLNCYGFGSLSPNFFLALNENRHAQGNERGELRFFLAGTTRSIWSLKDIEPFTHSDLPAEERIFFLPSINLLVAVGPGNDHLLLRHFNVKEALTAAGIDFLYVNSAPVKSATCGAQYDYQMQVESRRGNVACALAAGPDGMKVSREGHVSWSVPADFQQNDARVVLSVTDATGQQIFQTYTMEIAGVQKKPTSTAPRPPR